MKYLLAIIALFYDWIILLLMILICTQCIGQDVRIGTNESDILQIIAGDGVRVSTSPGQGYDIFYIQERDTTDTPEPPVIVEEDTLGAKKGYRWRKPGGRSYIGTNVPDALSITTSEINISATGICKPTDPISKYIKTGTLDAVQWQVPWQSIYFQGHKTAVRSDQITRLDSFNLETEYQEIFEEYKRLVNAGDKDFSKFVPANTAVNKCTYFEWTIFEYGSAALAWRELPGLPFYAIGMAFFERY